ncbi:hypothetical protein L8Q54_15285 [Enterobacter kobei]|uniref:hypothetical protein n=1 Tax=Enterobacter kobei TaxID=208224 RepID=UPI0020061643|nr:hypothetical protein [Enterobacter kobei]MCK6919629.1 hypothetical protein [Enterobacter kobei]
MSNIDKQALNQEKIEWLNKLADMEYCKSNPGHWLMSLKDTNMLAKLALRSVALLDELEAAESRIAELSHHLQCPHGFIEHTEAFGHEASNGILCCGDAQWDIDASKSALAAAAKGE